MRVRAAAVVVGVGAIGAWLAMLTGVWRASSESPVNRLATVEVPQVGASADSSSNAFNVSSAQHELESLRARLGALERRATAAGPASVPNARVEAEERVPLPPRERAAVIDARLANEGQDPAWASATQSALMTAFTEGGFVGSTIEDVSCVRTYCRMQVAHTNWKTQRAFTEIAGASLRMGTRMLPYELADGRIETVAYFVRKDFDTPEHPVRGQGL